MKILVITYPCSPYRGSEFSVSWNFVQNMSKHHELYVLYGTSGNGFGNVSEMNAYLNEHPMPNVHFIDVQSPQNVRVSFLALCRKINYLFGSYFQYKYWHKQVHQTAKELVVKENIDIIHFLNPIGFKEPGECWKVKNVPYVWGPLQAVENRPFALYKALDKKGKIGALGRLILHNGIFMLSHKIRQVMHRADVLFAATPNTVYMIKKIYHRDAIYLPENGIVKINRRSPITFQQGQILQLIWIGALCPRKALIILLDALNHTHSRQWHLDVIGGGGNLFKQLKEKSKQLGIDDHITWHGSIPRAEVLQLMKTAHLHVISSLGEATTTVLWEAMSWAVPTMTLDHCGMAGVVCEKCGIKIPIHSYKQVVTDMAEHIDHLIEQPEIIGQLSQGVIECSEKFMWSNRIKIFNEVYERICNKYSIH